MSNMDVSQLVSCITYLKCYLQDSLNQSDKLREINGQKDVKILEMQSKIENLETQIVTQNSEITELKNFIENISMASGSEHKIDQPPASSEDLKQCQNEMIIILKERCDDLTLQLMTTRRAWHDKCILIEKYRRELTDVGDQVVGVHKKLNDMKNWQKQIEGYYAALKESQEQNQMVVSNENSRITAEISDLKRVQNEQKTNDDLKNNSKMDGTGDGIIGYKKARRTAQMNQIALGRCEIVNCFEVYPKVGEFNQLELMKPTVEANAITRGMSLFWNLDLFGSIKTKFVKLIGCDNKNTKDSLIRFGVPATIICCFVTGTLLTQMIFKFPPNKGFTIAQLAGSKGFIISAPLP